MLGRLFQVLLCFVAAMQPASRSLSTDLYYRLAETGQPVLVTLVDTAAAQLADSALGDGAAEGGNRSMLGLNGTPFVLEMPGPAERNYSEAADAAFPVFTAKTVSGEQVERRAEPDVASPVAEVNDTDDSLTQFRDLNDSDSAKKIDIALKASESQEEIPSFAEWAQKQLEEAEKNMENVVNHSAKTPQGTVTSAVNLKVRSKNYASPDCGAKIIAANPESGSTGFILTSSRDEYMLNTCNSRIWFIVELCEAIQAKKVDMANFELFSSTPKNFSVFVSDRFPTREWASVGQFIARDERDIQTFNLHPHLFGKFIKVELHSHHGSEHYCPISLFRVYGTSEFEVFETENSPHSPASQGPDDDDDVIEDVADGDKQGDISRNLFGSARDAVMSIMKKAAQVLVKSGDSKNATTQLEEKTTEARKCRTPSHIIVCDNCSNSMFTGVYDLMSCQSDGLNALIHTPVVKDALCNTDICQQYGLDFKSKRTSSFKTEVASYISALLLPSYVAALCNMLAIVEKKVVLNTSYEADLNLTSNLTIDKKTQAGSKDGIGSELLQDPFTTCSEESDPSSAACRVKAKDELPPEVVAPIKIFLSAEVMSGSIADIRPTKTLQQDVNPIEPSVITVQPSSDRSNSVSFQTEKSRSSGYDIEASMLSEVNQEPTETLDRSKQEKNINESTKDSLPETMNVEQDKEKPDFASVVVSQEIGTEGENLSAAFDNEDVNMKLSTQEQLSLDTFLTELEQAHDPATPAPPQNTVSSLHQGQKESVFLRLSNRIKALERNMSLSGQYLEELSRRYKKQMEEMQKTFEKTLNTISEESQRTEERYQKNTEEMLVLQQQLAHISGAVSTLLTERDSWFGNLSLFKVMIFQIFLTILVAYIYRRNRTHFSNSPERRINKTKKAQVEKPTKMRRRSVEGSVGHTVPEGYDRKRRPSEEALHIARTATDMQENSTKSDKRKKKRKSSTFNRSISIAGATEAELVNLQREISIESKVPDEAWKVQGNVDASPVALEEAEFIVPEVEPIDFSRIGEVKTPNINGITPKKEFPKTNGSIFGMKFPNDKKSGKVRRLSSPAFFRTALGRQSSRSGSSNASTERSITVVAEDVLLPTNDAVGREIRSEDREVKREGSESPQLSSNWSSAGDVSVGSSTAPPDVQSNNSKRSKGRAFKNIFKKVF